MFVAILMVWFGCLLVFVSSRHQKFFTLKISQPVSWITFCCLLFTSWRMYSFVFDSVISGLIVLSFVMVMWTTIVIAHGHSSFKFLPFAGGGAVLFSVLGQLGVSL